MVENKILRFDRLSSNFFSFWFRVDNVIMLYVIGENIFFAKN